MADKVYRLKDVPKGQKLQFFFDYYKVHMAVAAFIISFIVIGIYELTHVPKFDMQITLFGQNMKISENVLATFESELEKLDIDLNKDEKVDVSVTPLIKSVSENGSSGEFNEVAYAQISIGDSYVMITDENILNDFLKPRSALLTYEEADLDGEGVIEIPYEQTIFNDYIEEEYFEREMFVVLKKGNFDDEKYAKEIQAFKNVILK